MAVDPKRQYLNSYLYCSNNPVLYIDSTGEWSFKHLFSTYLAEIVHGWQETWDKLKSGDIGGFLFEISIGQPLWTPIEATAVSGYSILPDIQNKFAEWGWFGVESESGAHGGSQGESNSYENYIKAQKKNSKSDNPFVRWEAKGRIAHTTQDRKHHTNSSVIKGPWSMVLSPTDFQHFEDIWPLVPDIPFMNSLRIWEGASDYSKEMYGTDLGF